MSHKGILSSAFNMSLGFVPVIISIFLCEIITQDIAIYIGTGIGIIGVFLSHRQKKILIPNFILYLSTAMLILISFASFIPGDYVPAGALPLDPGSEYSDSHAYTLSTQKTNHPSPPRKNKYGPQATL